VLAFVWRDRRIGAGVAFGVAAAAALGVTGGLAMRSGWTMLVALLPRRKGRTPSCSCQEAVERTRLAVTCIRTRRGLEEADQFADGVVAVVGMAKRKLAMDLVLVAATGARLREVAGLLQVIDDLRHRPLGDPDRGGDVPETRGGIRGYAGEHVSVVRHEPPRTIAVY
jgi:hypothetical protein